MTTPRASYKPDEFVVNYHDACIYGRDLSLLESPTAWLNDACINFYTTVLQRQQLEKFPETNTLFMDPSVISFLMHQCHDEDELREFSSGACKNFHGAKSSEGLRLVVPISDHFLASQDAWAVPSAGMHWSLLILSYLSKPSTSSNDPYEIMTLAFHLDSSGGNFYAAEAVAKMIHKTFCLSTPLAPEPLTLLECRVPRQQTGYDCGIHVLASAESILPLAPCSNKSDIEHAVRNEIGTAAISSYCLSFRKKVASRIRQEANLSGSPS